MRWAEHVVQRRRREMHVDGRSKGKRPMGRPKHRFVDKTQISLGEIGWGGVEWIGLVQDRGQWRTRVNVVMNFQVL
jgi:hypothetical protein